MAVNYGGCFFALSRGKSTLCVGVWGYTLSVSLSFFFMMMMAGTPNTYILFFTLCAHGAVLILFIIN